MRRIAIGLLIATGAGCRAGAETKAPFSVRDSVGVRIAETRGGAGGAPEWKVDEHPEIDITGAEPGRGPALFHVLGAVRLGDGRIVVANSGTSSLEIFSPAGTHLRSAGRAGGGPGEFRALTWVGCLTGDSIAAWDAGAGRLSVFSPAGDYARSVTPRQPLGIFPQPAGLLDGGGLLLALHGGTLGLSATADVHVQRDTLTYAVLDTAGGMTRIHRFPGMEMLASGNPSGGLVVMPLPFGQQTVAATHGSRIYAADGERFEVAEFTRNGRLRALIRGDRERQPVTARDVRRYRETLVTLGEEGNARLSRQYDELLDRAPYPARKPAITGLRVDEAGNLWVESPEPGRGNLATAWSVLSPEGRMIGWVRTPAGLNVQQVGNGWLLGTSADENGEYVRLYRVRKTR